MDVTATPTGSAAAGLDGALRRAAAAGSLAALTSGALNLLVLLVAQLAGIDFRVTPGGGRAITVNPLLVAGTTLAAVAVGTVLLALTVRRGGPAVRVVAWLGLAVGVLSTVAPLTLDASAAARGSLAVMHVVTGIVWWVVVQRRLPTDDRPGR